MLNVLNRSVYYHLVSDCCCHVVICVCCVYVCVSRQKDRQVLYYNSSINRLFLEVNVSNTPSPGRPAEDAHNAVLNISIPQLLIYSGVRTKVVKLKVFQPLENKDGDVEQLVICIEVDI